MSIRCLTFVLVLGLASLLRAEDRRYICDGDPRPLWLPGVKLKDVTLDEAIDYLRAETKKLDIISRPPTGINVVVKDPLGKIDRKKRISLELQSVPVGYALNVMCQLLDVKMEVEPYAVVIAPKDDPERMRTLHIDVPPDFRHIAESLH